MEFAFFLYLFDSMGWYDKGTANETGNTQFGNVSFSKNEKPKGATT